jgi:DNA invertase Pin-like site-specific DNA recombinase
MSRAVLMIALAKTLGRAPTDAERTEYLAAMAELAGGEYLYVPKLPQSHAVDMATIQRMRSDGWSIRRIAREVRCSKSQVHRALSQLSPYVVDKEAA